jgi:hypothetical protein
MCKLRYLVSFAGLELISSQTTKAVESIEKGEPRPVCTGAFHCQYGILCWHQIVALVVQDTQLNIKHIDKHWWLKHEQVSLRPIALHSRYLTKSAIVR